MIYDFIKEYAWAVWMGAALALFFSEGTFQHWKYWAYTLPLVALVGWSKQ